jgi:pimeloyl-ACP methyl ester carboxylesterase
VTLSHNHSDQAPVAVLLPGTASDEVFVREVFQRPLRAVGIRLITPAPVPGRGVAEAHLRALSSAAEDAPVLVGGISLGAHLAAEWAVRHPGRCAGLLLALPAWHGPADGRPASIAARYSARAVRAHGVEPALAEATEGIDAWLAGELRRAWRRHGDGLADTLDSAATRAAPTLDALRGIRAPAGIAACADDPVHPPAVAEAWAAALPTAGLTVTTLRALGSDRESLGRATVHAWLQAGGRP